MRWRSSGIELEEVGELVGIEDTCVDMHMHRYTHSHMHTYTHSHMHISTYTHTPW